MPASNPDVTFSRSAGSGRVSLEGCLSASLALNAASCAAAGLVAGASGGGPAARTAVTRELMRRSRQAAMRAAFDAVVRGAFAAVGAGAEGVTGGNAELSSEWYVARPLPTLCST